MTRHIHHSCTHHGTYDHSEGGYEHNGLELRHLGSDGGIEEVDGIVAHSHKKVEHCQYEQEDHNQ